MTGRRAAEKLGLRVVLLGFAAAHEAVDLIREQPNSFWVSLAIWPTASAGHAGCTLDALKQHVRENLANYKVPRDIMFSTSCPAAAPARSSVAIYGHASAPRRAAGLSTGRNYWRALLN